MRTFVFLAMIALVRVASAAPLIVSAEPTMDRRNVDVNLLELQKQEVRAAEAELPKSLPREIRGAQISRVLSEKNREFLFELESAPALTAGLTREQASKLLESVRENPVVGEAAGAKYDTWNRMIGYCFGRAAFVHWNLLRLGVAPKNIAKAFAVGGLRREPREFPWDYHMATLTRARDGGWWVIDPLMPEVLKVDPWMKAVLKWSAQNPDPRLRFYVSDAIKLFPIAGAYAEEPLSRPEYKGYFKDLSNWFAEHPAPKSGLVE